MQIERHGMLALSTGHVPSHFGSMDRVPRYSKQAPGPHFEQYGWFVPIVEGEPVPEELRPLWKFAKEQGCTWLMLDRDAERIEGLPFWEW